jgi:hypothetical protein
MTVAIALKVHDGVVLAADSAQTLADQQGGVVNVYNHANKISNIRKGLPVGFISWGVGSIGNASIVTVAKDLRRRLSGQDPEHPDWNLDPGAYTLKDVVERTREYVYDELYIPAFGEWETKPDLGFIVAGYSAGAALGEVYQVVVQNGACSEPQPLLEEDTGGVVWQGQPDPITRLLRGMGSALPTVLKDNLGVPEEQIAAATETIGNALNWPVVSPSMPIQDAIDLAEFLVDVTINYYRFGPGAPTVGGAVDSAVITKHEGFKWVKRKHYFSDEFNREDFSGRDWGHHPTVA